MNKNIDNHVCSKCGTAFNNMSSSWQKHPFGIHYCWEYELENTWYHRCGSPGTCGCGCAIPKQEYNLKREIKNG